MPNLGQQDLPNLGQQITPLAPRGSRFVPLNPELPEDSAWLAGQAVSTVVSPDQKTLLVLTSGYNRVYDTDSPAPNPAESNEYVFIYDISTATPVKKQVVQIANTYNGIVFDPSGWAFYVSGCMDDRIQIITRSASGTWGQQDGNFLDLGHEGRGLGLNIDPNGAKQVNQMVGVAPCAAGVAISGDGQTLVVANYYNDSITVFSGGYGNWSSGTELDLRPGKNDSAQRGVAGGEYPFWVAVKGRGANTTAYVSSLRDREIVVVDLSGAPQIMARIPVKGQPNKMTLNAAQTRLYVVEDQSDTIDVIDTASNSLIATIPLVPVSLLPPSLAEAIDAAEANPDQQTLYTGANPNSVALSPDETQLYVSNGNLNFISVVNLDEASGGGEVVGFIPTGWYPNSVSFGAVGRSPDGQSPMVYVVNGKSPTGPNPGWCYGSGSPTYDGCWAANEYNPQLTKAGLQSFPLPDLEQLTTLTAQVAINNRFSSEVSAEAAAVMAAVREGVKHVIYIIKENRTYDQILGDLEVGNGDPFLAQFGEAITPNQHQLARTFVTLDNFYASSETSYDGWPWTTSARAPDVIERQYPVVYAGRGLSLESEGLNRNVNVALPTVAPGQPAHLLTRQQANPLTPDDPDLLAGQTSVAAPDGPDNEVNTGYLWDAALRAGLTVRNYGFFVDVTRYNFPQDSAYSLPLLKNPAATRTTVAYPSSVSLAPHTDPYFRGFDNAFPDYYRYKEWEREFDTKYARGGLPALSLVRFMHNHTGNFDTAIDGVNTPELQVADNDYAVGLLVEKIANSRYANDTLIFIIEDDAQDGADHVDSHRTVAFVAGAYVKQGAVVSSQYNTVDFLRTIEEVLGLPPLNLNDALAIPMADIFNPTPTPWSFRARPSTYLYGTDLPLPPRQMRQPVPRSTRDADYWARATRGMDFSVEDRFDFATYNRILWRGLMGDRPYPDAPTGLDLRANRDELLGRYRQSLRGR
ncbi:phosphoesterase [Allochromatium palmeri]|uniref:Phosphoesterase n=2 Tax=Allochromatium palmeri TaxID=231048 RepID=A0A6N8EAQ8_9GAMM|nr:phosphoesterase [Allochromatium palmeri]